MSKQKITPQTEDEQQKQAIINDLQALKENVTQYADALGIPFKEALDLLQQRETIILNKQLKLVRDLLTPKANNRRGYR